MPKFTTVKFSKISSVSQFIKKAIHTINKTYLKVDFIINFIIEWAHKIHPFYNEFYFFEGFTKVKS